MSAPRPFRVKAPILSPHPRNHPPSRTSLPTVSTHQPTTAPQSPVGCPASTACLTLLSPSGAIISVERWFLLHASLAIPLTPTHTTPAHNRIRVARQRQREGLLEGSVGVYDQAAYVPWWASWPATASAAAQSSVAVAPPSRNLPWNSTEMQYSLLWMKGYRYRYGTVAAWTENAFDEWRSSIHWMHVFMPRCGPLSSSRVQIFPVCQGRF